MDQEKIGVPINDELMKEKRFNPRLYVIANILSGYDGIIASVSERNEIGKRLGLGRTKFMKDYDYLIEKGFIRETEQGNQVRKMLDKREGFVSVDKDSIERIADKLNDFDFKVYLYLLNKNNIYKTYHYKEPHKFSKSSLLSAVGYHPSGRNIDKMQETLDRLVSLGLIEYSEKRYGSMGTRGTYWKLLDVKNNLTEENENDILNETVEKVYRF